MLVVVAVVVVVGVEVVVVGGCNDGSVVVGCWGPLFCVWGWVSTWSMVCQRRCGE